jgi:integrase
MNLSYYLETRSERESKKPTPITLYVRYRTNVDGRSKTQTVKLSTGQKVAAKYWDSEKQRVKSSYTGANELNSWLASKQGAASKILLQVSSDNDEITTAKVKELVRPLFVEAAIVVEETLSFWKVYERFIEVRSTQKSDSTLKKYKTTLSHLKDFAEAYSYKVAFENLDHKFLEQFITYLLKEKKHTNNTVEKNVTILKTFLGWATENEYNTKLTFKKFGYIKEQVDIVYLTEEELHKLYNLDLNEKEALQRVRDVFCFGCFTGQRFSDILRIAREQIRGNTWYIVTQKTKDVLEVPLNSYALAILNKYKDNARPLPVVSNQKTNEHLKDLCELAGIDEYVTLTKYRGAEKIQEHKKKYEVVGTHTARRTFVTLWLEKGGRPETCMEITGHKDYKTFKKYIKITSKVKRVEMEKVFESSPPIMKAV